MTHSRNGKIARLPREVRDELNQRLHDGEPGVRLVEWLNSLPSVQAALADGFDGRPMNEQNLTEWKQGGYEDWLTQQEVLGAVQQALDDAAQLKDAVPGSLAEPMAQLLTARLSVALRQLRTQSEDGRINLGQLHVLCADLVELRRGDQNAERLRIERERLQLDRERLELERGQEQMRTVEQFCEWAQQDAIKEKICGRADNSEKIEALGRIMFGELWDKAKKASADSNQSPASPPCGCGPQAESNQIKPNQTGEGAPMNSPSP